jgi:hypothetical protein
MRSRRCRLVVLAAAGAAVALAVGFWMLWPPTHITAITWANAAKVQPGMTLDEVEAILGGPARFDATGPVSYCLTGVEGFDPTVPRPPEWLSDEVLVMVYLDANRRVQRCVPVTVQQEDRNVIGIIRRRFGP